MVFLTSSAASRPYGWIASHTCMSYTVCRRSLCSFLLGSPSLPTDVTPFLSLSLSLSFMFHAYIPPSDRPWAKPCRVVDCAIPNELHYLTPHHGFRMDGLRPMCVVACSAIFFLALPSSARYMCVRPNMFAVSVATISSHSSPRLSPLPLPVSHVSGSFCAVVLWSADFIECPLGETLSGSKLCYS